jgi:hypothetical protein
VNAAILAQRNHLLNQRLGRLGLGNGGVNAIVQNNRGNKVAKQSAAMAGIASQLESAITVAHDDLLRPGLLPGSGTAS